jgi:hypothetical protein
MSELEKRFHAEWLGLVQPEGLVVSIPVLIEAQCMSRQHADVQARLLELCPEPTDVVLLPGGRREERPTGPRAIADLPAVLDSILDLKPAYFDAGPAIPEALSVYVPEGQQTVRPTLALKDPAANSSTHVALLWDLAAFGPSGIGLPFDKPETHTGTWEYPPAAKFERLLRHTRIPIGLLTNREVIRLIYAPHGESAGHIDFRIADMAEVGGRPILDAFVMLLSATRFFSVAAPQALPALLSESRKRQANVTNELADQVFDALQILLRGFEAAAERDGHTLLSDALDRDNDHLYRGLLTVLLRMVFVLYGEDRGVLPTDRPFYANHLSLLGLFARLQADHGAHPDSMPRRFGAWGQLIALFRAVYLGAHHGDLHMPARRGNLFDPHTYPFLEGWGPAGAAPIVLAEHRAEVKLPTVDDETVFLVLEKLVLFDGQRLSYRTLDVEQIGSVYEALMGFHVQRMYEPAVCMRPDGVWLTAEKVSKVPRGQRAKWLKESVGLSTAQASKLVEALGDAPDTKQGFAALSEYAMTGRKRERALSFAKAGQLVLQPGAERQRTSSHYTPRTLSEPIVRRTLEPLLKAMGETPSSDRILELKVCDPAMGSGAFLVEACRFLGDQLIAAWTREGKLEAVAKDAPNEDPVLHARRLVAQRCLYGVDKNDSAVELAKLSLWLLTLAKDLPFTFLDHSLRHGDSLVGLSFDQIRAFHWKPEKQLTLADTVLQEALDEAINIRQQILKLAADPSPEAQREKERLADDATDASSRARLIADLVIGAFFAHDKDKDREKERLHRLDLFTTWIDESAAGGHDPEGDRVPSAVHQELLAMQSDLRSRIPAFHWMLEFPEVFYLDRPDPLDNDRVNHAAQMDAFIGNPPFAGKNSIADFGGPLMLAWLQALHEGAHGNADYSAHFFRRANALLGSRGTIGLIATNTIAQGDTRDTALEPLVRSGLVIHDATESMPWPGEAAVTVSVVHLAKGLPDAAISPKHLNGKAVEIINSRLGTGAGRPVAVTLASNAGACFQGSIVLGMGFVLTPEERDALVTRNKRNAERIFPYLGGEEVNTSPTHAFDRYVINFGPVPLEDAEDWPDLIKIIRERVKPERDKLNDNADGRRRKQYWWHFGRFTPALEAAIAPLDRCLITMRVKKHNAFTFVPNNCVFANTMYVFPFDKHGQFAVLQSRAHDLWTVALSSTLGMTQNYSATDCFENFPFPAPDPRTVIPALEDIGKRLYETRAAFMLENNQGLTKTYNALKSPTVTDPKILDLRTLHEELDRQVLSAYADQTGDKTWSEIQVPPFTTPATDAEKSAQDFFKESLLDRLHELNAQRAAEESRLGLGAKKGTKAKKPKDAIATAAKKLRGKKKSIPDQTSLLPEDGE